MMERVPEPQLMLDMEQARAYAHADFDEPHDHFIALLIEQFPDLPPAGMALDLGCGAGDISRRFARKMPHWRVDGVDGSSAMLTLADELTTTAEFDQRIRFDEVLLPASPPQDKRYELIFSNSLLHHLDDPAVFWSSLREWSVPGGRVFAMDLLRPASIEIAAEFVRRYAADEPQVLQTDFYNSLLAAYELAEIDAQLVRAGLDELTVKVVSDRHFIVYGSMRK